MAKTQTKNGGPVAMPHGWAGAMAGCEAHGVLTPSLCKERSNSETASIFLM